nr:MAG TPA: hypothetical protein [Caudoviricetes sp.]
MCENTLDLFQQLNPNLSNSTSLEFSCCIFTTIPLLPTSRKFDIMRFRADLKSLKLLILLTLS